MSTAILTIRRAQSSDLAALKIRELEPRDVDAVVEMGRQEWPNIFPGEPFDADHIRGIVLCHFNRDAFGAWVIAGDEGALYGFYSLGLSPVLMTRKRVAEDVWWYVDPCVRGRLGMELVRVGEAWAKSRGAHAVHLGIHHEKYRPIMQRMGYNLATLTFEKVL